jgi:OmcA/MtrC family decaheme c-type cytochrome
MVETGGFMMTSRRIGSSAVLGATLFVLGGCGGGDTGAAGPPGAEGEAGAAGAPGAPGKDGTPGKNALSKTSAEPPGSNCPNGGTKLEVGIDTDGNGTLDPAEVTGTSYICGGSGKNTLVKTSPEPAGANCAFGGEKIETGLDANGDGTLQPTEVNAASTSYVCNIAPSGAISPSTGINVAVVPGGVSTATTGPITVRFTIKDDRGFPIDINGKYSVNTAFIPRFALAYFTKDATTGIVSPFKVYTSTASASAAPVYNPATYNPSTPGGVQGTLVENGLGAGDYTYTFPATATAATATVGGVKAVQYDPAHLSDPHVVWIQAQRQTDAVFVINANTSYTSNQDYYFVPSGTGTPIKREIVAQSGCDACHMGFKLETTTSAGIHGGGRVNANFCNICHNPDRVSGSGADANSNRAYHRIHYGEHIQTANIFDGVVATYPQDIRNCTQCHAATAAQGGQYATNLSRSACGSCHDSTDFTGTATTLCTHPPTLDASGQPVACKHMGGAQATDNACLSCHKADGTGAAPSIADSHKPVAGPAPYDTTNAALTAGYQLGATPKSCTTASPCACTTTAPCMLGSANVNASYVAATGYVPAGSTPITYDLKSVDKVADTTTPTIMRPRITFRFMNGTTPVVFQTYAAGTVTELMPNFVGSPSVYWVFTVPEDGTNAPADYNASASGYIKNIWNGTATGAGAGTMTFDAASGYYTIVLTGVQIPSTATMLTGGLGYSYSLSGTPPLVQTNVSGYPYNPTTKIGGLSVPAPDVWKTATGYTSRRLIVDNAKCKNCHVALGVTPTFHAGQRNDGPTCVFCHNPNRTSSGWSAASDYFIHAIHAGRKRVVPFNWHAAAPGQDFSDVGFPSPLNECTACHVPNTYDFTNATNLSSIASQELTAVATGKFDGNPTTNPTGYFAISPYVTADNVTDYGAGFSYNAATNTTTPAAGTNLVISHITTACSACHDTPTALNHMKANGAIYYGTRAAALASDGEQCLICHGPGRIAAIGIVHQR